MKPANVALARALRVGLVGLAAALVALLLGDGRLGAEPDSRGEGRIVFGFGESGALHPAQLAVMDVDGKHRRLLPLDHVFSVSWSPDGRRIAYDVLAPAARPNTYRRDVWTMHVDGRPRYRRVVRNGESADWSPSGREIAFERGGNIWIVDLNDHRQRRIIRRGHSPRWSPDGKRLVFEPASTEAADVSSSDSGHIAGATCSPGPSVAWSISPCRAGGPRNARPDASVSAGRAQDTSCGWLARRSSAGR